MMDLPDLSKRFWLFVAGDCDDANGGMEDCQRSYESVDAAMADCAERFDDWICWNGHYHILDVEERRIVGEGCIDVPEGKDDRVLMPY